MPLIRRSLATATATAAGAADCLLLSPAAATVAQLATATVFCLLTHTLEHKVMRSQRSKEEERQHREPVVTSLQRMGPWNTVVAMPCGHQWTLAQRRLCCFRCLTLPATPHGAAVWTSERQVDSVSPSIRCSECSANAMPLSLSREKEALVGGESNEGALVSLLKRTSIPSATISPHHLMMT